MTLARLRYNFMRAFGGYLVNKTVGVQIEPASPRGVLAVYETKMLLSARR